MKHVIHPNFQGQSEQIAQIIADFWSKGKLFANGKRNKIKLFPLGDITANVKGFGIPNIVNRVAYNFFRRSKAERSYDFAMILLGKGIGTPQPIAFFENFSLFLFDDSYYVSEHLDVDLTFRELTTDFDFPDHEKILRQFTRFSYKLHENGVEFIDNTPGNTLIKKMPDGNYEFFLVDLNRMAFHKGMPLEMRIHNMAKLTSKPELISVMSDEYAKISGESRELIQTMMQQKANANRERFLRKKKIRQRLKIWKK